MNPKINQKKIRRWLFGEFSWQRLLRSLIFVYVSIGLWAYFFANSLIFQPQPATYADNSQILKLTSANGVKISAIYQTLKEKKMIFIRIMRLF